MAKKIIACIFVFLFLLTSFVALDVKEANATKVSMTWGYLNNLSGMWNSTEYAKEIAISTDIYNMFSSGTWSRQNAYGSLTTTANVYNTLDYIVNPSNNVDWSTTWWVGDFNPSMSNPPTPFGYFGCFTSNVNSYVYDYDVYTHATASGTRDSKNYFTFMWTCSNGGIYWLSPSGGYSAVQGIIFPVVSSSMPNWVPSNTNSYYGYRVNPTQIVGMPYAWTGTTGMSLNGYTNPSGSYTYIGWECSSPFMGNKPPSGSSSTGAMYYDCPYYFYRFALGQDNSGTHGTVKQSLDYAARKTFGEKSPGVDYTFSTSILNVGQWRQESAGWFYCRMRVFGNGNMVLP